MTKLSKIKRFIWAYDEALNNGFSDVIWIENTVQLESHRRHSFRKNGGTSYSNTPTQAPHKTSRLDWNKLKRAYLSCYLQYNDCRLLCFH